MSNIASTNGDVLIGQRLAQIRKNKSMNQNDFSKTLGVSLRGYQNYERGERAISKELICALISTYEIDTKWLLTGEGNMYHQTDTQENQPSDSLIQTTQSKEEEVVLELFRMLPPDEKKRIKGVIEERQQIIEMMEKVRRLEEEKGKSA